MAVTVVFARGGPSGTCQLDALALLLARLAGGFTSSYSTAVPSGEIQTSGSPAVAVPPGTRRLVRCAINMRVNGTNALDSAGNRPHRSSSVVVTRMTSPSPTTRDAMNGRPSVVLTRTRPSDRRGLVHVEHALDGHVPKSGDEPALLAGSAEAAQERRGRDRLRGGGIGRLLVRLADALEVEGQESRAARAEDAVVGEARFPGARSRGRDLDLIERIPDLIAARDDEPAAVADELRELVDELAGETLEAVPLLGSPASGMRLPGTGAFRR